MIFEMLHIQKIKYTGTCPLCLLTLFSFIIHKLSECVYIDAKECVDNFFFAGIEAVKNNMH